jgi:predicted NACHT family NTPase
MISLLCSLYVSDRYIPRSLPGVISKCAELLFERWDRQRGIETRLRFDAHLRSVVQQMAWQMFQLNEPWLTRSGALRVIADLLYERRFDDERDALMAAEDFLNFCAGRSWILTEMGVAQAEPLYGFTDRTFMEYFCAERLIRQNSDPGALYRAIAPNLADMRWQMVSELAAHLFDQNVEDGAQRLLQVALDAAEPTTEQHLRDLA